ncbi:ABC transporter permease subunit [Erysipelothrix urinaevulpis]|uniref:ABC transporter permease subunit n=1 Tax=Erysipelothrix urinaevulpis TaxID=2683717 RepID=UPI00135C39F0|nr:ABC transporter permease subunit [Erysipelothrix urinaevulpis]
MKKKNKSRLILIIFFLFAVILPLFNLFTYVRRDDIKILIFTDGFSELMFNSLSTTILATFISVSLALFVSGVLRRSQIKFKNMFNVVLTVPMLIPSISHAIGLIILFGHNGIITQFLDLHFNLFGFVGIVMGSILYSFPVAFLLISDALSYEDYTSYEACEILGIPKVKQFLNITLPNIGKPLLAACFAVFTMIFTDYGVPLMIGGKFQTLSAYMYREIIGLLNFSNGAIIGVVLLIPAFIAFIVDLKIEKERHDSTLVRKFVVKENKKRDLLANIILILISVIFLLPIFAFVLLSVVEQFPKNMSLSLRHFKDALQLDIVDYLINSLTIALSTALLGTVVSYLTAYITARSNKTPTVLFLHLLSMFSLAIPGVVLGLSYVLFFNSTFIYNTIFILILVNIVHFFSSPYLMAYNSLSGYGSSFNDLAEVHGISKWRMLVDVFIPNTQLTIFEMFSFFFTNSMITISAVSFLSNVRNQPLALLIPQLDAQSLIEATALVSLLILICNIIFKSGMYFFKQHKLKGENNE